MIVTIDGPAGAGKSSVAKALASRLDFCFLDTGAMYRAVTLAAIRAKVNWQDNTQLAEIAASVEVAITDGHVMLDGADVTQAIRQSPVTEQIHFLADLPEVRKSLSQMQRDFADTHPNIITEGRDQGTAVFPHAECKIFLTASPTERARRRLGDLAHQDEIPSLEALLAQQNERDHRDQNREVGALRQAEDAVAMITDGMTQDEVVHELEAIVQKKMATLSS